MNFKPGDKVIVKEEFRTTDTTYPVLDVKWFEGERYIHLEGMDTEGWYLADNYQLAADS